MLKEINYKDEQGNNICVSVIGFFRVSDLEKEFVMYSIVDDNDLNEDGLVLLGEVIRNGDDIKIVGIDASEKDMVVAYYNEISEQIGGSEDE